MRMVHSATVHTNKTVLSCFQRNSVYFVGFDRARVLRALKCRNFYLIKFLCDFVNNVTHDSRPRASPERYPAVILRRENLMLLLNK